MALTANVAGAKTQKLEFPCLMTDCLDGMIVLFSADKKGTIIGAGRQHSLKIGDWSATWDMDMFSLCASGASVTLIQD